ncbi:MAG: hypothetical protein JNM94_03680 [Phycisphaerae bacterium]|nr:hypothetical protein [Phycisphaerae bacterium]
MHCLRTISPICVSLVALSLVGCGGDPPAEKPTVAVPAELATDAATLAAMKDAKFADFKKVVLELRAASKVANDYLASIGGKATTQEQASRFQELSAVRDGLKARTNEMMSDAAWTDADRKAMRAIFAAPESQLK